MNQLDCIIIGAGLSGLASAMTLQKAGLKPLVIEAAEEVGGRVKTYKTPDGFLTDVGFQVLLSSYPELSYFVDLPALNLKKFNSGALVLTGDKLELLANPLTHPETLVSSIFGNLVTIKDKALVLKLIAQCQLQRDDFPLGTKSTAVFLKEFGFSDDFIELFWRPFLTGIYLDSELEMGENFFKFLMRCFASGKVSVPEKGMSQQLPKECLMLNQTVKSWAANHVVLASGETLRARKIICSTNVPSARSGLNENEFRMVTTHYFTGEELNKTNWGKWLVLVPKRLGMGIDHLCLISSVSAEYGNGKPLLSVSVVGDKNVGLPQVISEVNKLAMRDLKLEFVISHSVPKALPRITEEATGFKVIADVVYCGDRWASPSINGALKSGRMAAEYLVRELKKDSSSKDAT